MSKLLSTVNDNQYFDIKNSISRCKEVRRRILDISQLHGAIHIGGSFSYLEMLDVIYFGLMRKDREDNFLDSFILSKGHGFIR